MIKKKSQEEKITGNRAYNCRKSTRSIKRPKRYLQDDKDMSIRIFYEKKNISFTIKPIGHPYNFKCKPPIEQKCKHRQPVVRPVHIDFSSPIAPKKKLKEQPHQVLRDFNLFEDVDIFSKIDHQITQQLSNPKHAGANVKILNTTIIDAKNKSNEKLVKVDIRGDFPRIKKINTINCDNNNNKKCEKVVSVDAEGTASKMKIINTTNRDGGNKCNKKIEKVVIVDGEGTSSGIKKINTINCDDNNKSNEKNEKVVNIDVRGSSSKMKIINTTNRDGSNKSNKQVKKVVTTDVEMKIINTTNRDASNKSNKQVEKVVNVDVRGGSPKIKRINMINCDDSNNSNKKCEKVVRVDAEGSSSKMKIINTTNRDASNKINKQVEKVVTTDVEMKTINTTNRDASSIKSNKNIEKLVIVDGEGSSSKMKMLNTINRDGSNKSNTKIEKVASSASIAEGSSSKIQILNTTNCEDDNKINKKKEKVVKVDVEGYTSKMKILNTTNPDDSNKITKKYENVVNVDLKRLKINRNRKFSVKNFLERNNIAQPFVFISDIFSRKKTDTNHDGKSTTKDTEINDDNNKLDHKDGDDKGLNDKYTDTKLNNNETSYDNKNIEDKNCDVKDGVEKEKINNTRLDDCNNIADKVETDDTCNNYIDSYTNVDHNINDKGDETKRSDSDGVDAHDDSNCINGEFNAKNKCDNINVGGENEDQVDGNELHNQGTDNIPNDCIEINNTIMPAKSELSLMNNDQNKISVIYECVRVQEHPLKMTLKTVSACLKYKSLLIKKYTKISLNDQLKRNDKINCKRKRSTDLPEHQRTENKIMHQNSPECPPLASPQDPIPDISLELPVDLLTDSPSDLQTKTILEAATDPIPDPLPTPSQGPPSHSHSDLQTKTILEAATDPMPDPSPTPSQGPLSHSQPQQPELSSVSAINMISKLQSNDLPNYRQSIPQSEGSHSQICDQSPQNQIVSSQHTSQFDYMADEFNKNIQQQQQLKRNSPIIETSTVPVTETLDIHELKAPTTIVQPPERHQPLLSQQMHSSSNESPNVQTDTIEYHPPKQQNPGNQFKLPYLENQLLKTSVKADSVADCMNPFDGIKPAKIKRTNTISYACASEIYDYNRSNSHRSVIVSAPTAVIAPCTKSGGISAAPRINRTVSLDLRDSIVFKIQHHLPSKTIPVELTAESPPASIIDPLSLPTPERLSTPLISSNLPSVHVLPSNQSPLLSQDVSSVPSSNLSPVPLSLPLKSPSPVASQLPISEKNSSATFNASYECNRPQLNSLTMSYVNGSKSANEIKEIVKQVQDRSGDLTMSDPVKLNAVPVKDINATVQQHEYIHVCDYQDISDDEDQDTNALDEVEEQPTTQNEVRMESPVHPQEEIAEQTVNSLPRKFLFKPQELFSIQDKILEFINQNNIVLDEENVLPKNVESVEPEMEPILNRMERDLHKISELYPILPPLPQMPPNLNMMYSRCVQNLDQNLHNVSQLPLNKRQQQPQQNSTPSGFLIHSHNAQLSLPELYVPQHHSVQLQSVIQPPSKPPPLPWIAQSTRRIKPSSKPPKPAKLSQPPPVNVLQSSPISTDTISQLQSNQLPTYLQPIHQHVFSRSSPPPPSPPPPPPRPTIIVMQSQSSSKNIASQLQSNNLPTYRQPIQRSEFSSSSLQLPQPTQLPPQQPINVIHSQPTSPINTISSRLQPNDLPTYRQPIQQSEFSPSSPQPTINVHYGHPSSIHENSQLKPNHWTTYVQPINQSINSCGSSSQPPQPSQPPQLTKQTINVIPPQPGLINILPQIQPNSLTINCQPIHQCVTCRSSSPPPQQSQSTINETHQQPSSLNTISQLQPNNSPNYPETIHQSVISRSSSQPTQPPSQSTINVIHSKISSIRTIPQFQPNNLAINRQPIHQSVPSRSSSQPQQQPQSTINEIHPRSNSINTISQLQPNNSPNYPETNHQSVISRSTTQPTQPPPQSAINAIHSQTSPIRTIPQFQPSNLAINRQPIHQSVPSRSSSQPQQQPQPPINGIHPRPNSINTISQLQSNNSPNYPETIHQSVISRSSSQPTQQLQLAQPQPQSTINVIHPQTCPIRTIPQFQANNLTINRQPIHQNVTSSSSSQPQQQPQSTINEIHPRSNSINTISQLQPNNTPNYPETIHQSIFSRSSSQPTQPSQLTQSPQQSTINMIPPQQNSIHTIPQFQPNHSPIITVRQPIDQSVSPHHSPPQPTKNVIQSNNLLNYRRPIEWFSQLRSQPPKNVQQSHQNSLNNFEPTKPNHLANHQNVLFHSQTLHDHSQRNENDQRRQSPCQCDECKQRMQQQQQIQRKLPIPAISMIPDNTLQHASAVLSPRSNIHGHKGPTINIQPSPIYQYQWPQINGQNIINSINTNSSPNVRTAMIPEHPSIKNNPFSQQPQLQNTRCQTPPDNFNLECVNPFDDRISDEIKRPNISAIDRCAAVTRASRTVSLDSRNPNIYRMQLQQHLQQNHQREPQQRSSLLPPYIMKYVRNHN